jgi:hypothetical protein
MGRRGFPTSQQEFGEDSITPVANWWSIVGFVWQSVILNPQND